MWKYCFVLCLLFSLITGSIEADEIDNLIPCIIKIESGGDPNAVGSSGEIGLMQISPIVLEEFNEKARYGQKPIPVGSWQHAYGYKLDWVIYGNDEIWWPFERNDLFNEEFNLMVGEWYLRRLKDHYLKENYTIERLLAAYNGGITRLRKNDYDVSKMPKSTQAYVKKVLKCYRRSK